MTTTMTSDSDLATPPDPGAVLIRVGKMPPADALSPSGMTCWSWASICRALQADPYELAAILKPVHLETQHKIVGGFREQNE